LIESTEIMDEGRLSQNYIQTARFKKELYQQRLPDTSLWTVEEEI